MRNFDSCIVNKKTYEIVCLLPFTDHRLGHVYKCTDPNNSQKLLHIAEVSLKKDEMGVKLYQKESRLYVGFIYIYLIIGTTKISSSYSPSI